MTSSVYHKRTSDISPIVNRVRLEINASDTIIEEYVKQAILDFCETSKLWVENVGPVRLKDSIDIYDVAPQKGIINHEIVSVSYVDTYGNEVFIPSADSSSGFLSWRGVSNDEIGIYNISRELDNSSVDVLAVLKPSVLSDSFKFSERIINNHLKTIVLGARSYLFGLQGFEWSNINISELLLQKFEAECVAVNVSVKEGYSNNSRSTRQSSLGAYL